MYLELMTAATEAQRGILLTYVGSGSLREIGIYMVAMNQVTTEFFREVTPPPACRPLHDAFLVWLETGREALIEKVERGKSVNSEKSRQFEVATRQLTASREEYVASIANPGHSTR